MPIQYDAHGRPIGQISMQSNKNQNQAKIQIFPTKAVPIIFLPGIMGSNLIAKGDNGKIIDYQNNKWAWYPDEISWFTGIRPGKSFAQTSPENRRKLLNPESTLAFETNGDYVSESIKKSIKKALAYQVINYQEDSSASLGFRADVKSFDLMSLDEALNRGWGTVYWAGYGAILAYLEKSLRDITYNEKSSIPLLKTFNTLFYEKNSAYHAILAKDFPNKKVPTESEYKRAKNHEYYRDEINDILKKGSKYHYPVFAIGYNWTQCNAESAKHAYKRITEQIIPHVKNVLGYSCDDGIIILTHSMGGLVGRSLVKQFPSLKIQAVVHGVQPCNGAATLYARMWAGWEGGKHWYSIKSNIAGRSMGLDRSELLPILSQSPGAMQLSPNQNYSKGWLRIYEKNTKKLLKCLPEKDPYSEIYLQTKNWLRLGSFGHMNPGVRSAQKIQQTKSDYRQVIDKAKVFHEQIDNFFHPNTYLMYGQFTDYKAWGCVKLTVEGLTLKDKTVYQDDLRGMPGSKEIISVKEVPIQDKEHRSQGRFEIKYKERIANKNSISLDVVENAVFRKEEDVPTREKGLVDIQYKDQFFQVTMLKAEEPGDGTVPYNSANPWKAAISPWDKDNWDSSAYSSLTPTSIKYIFEAKESEYEHSESYNDNKTQSITLYSIMSVIKNKLV